MRRPLKSTCDWILGQPEVWNSESEDMSVQLDGLFDDLSST